MEDNKNIKMPPKRRMGPPGRGMAPVEKAKDFKGSIGKLIRYIGCLLYTSPSPRDS